MRAPVTKCHQQSVPPEGATVPRYRGLVLALKLAHTLHAQTTLKHSCKEEKLTDTLIQLFVWIVVIADH